MFRLAACLTLLCAGELTFAVGQNNNDAGRAPPNTSDTPLNPVDAAKPATVGDIQRMLNSKLDAFMQRVDQAMPRMIKDIEDLQRRVSELERTKSAPDPSVSQYSPGISRSMRPRPDMALVLLVNASSAWPMTSEINGVVYSVEPGRSQPVEVQPGSVNVMVYEDSSNRTRNLNPREKLIITMR